MIPQESEVYLQLKGLVSSSSILVISGLPGVGKSLYVNQVIEIARLKQKNIAVIQWDVARKAFESKECAELFPMGDGVVHNGVKLCAGFWLTEVVADWIRNHDVENDFLVIEAPLVGHRFIEIMQVQEDSDIESFLASEKMKVLVPIPSREVRMKIEEARMVQVDEGAQSWMGAKPSVMLLIWKELCELANDLGKNIDVSGQPPYDPEVYKFVFQRVLQNRHFVPIIIDEIFEINVQDEKELHDTGSLMPNLTTANSIGEQIKVLYPDLSQIDLLVNNWYKT